MESRHLEVEVKLEAPQNAQLPVCWPAELQELQSAEYELKAVYYDTKDRQLARMGVALRQRTGGLDAGWHLKRRVAAGAQEETLWPPAAQLPDGAQQALEDFVPAAAAKLMPVAEILTQRKTTVLGIAETALYEIADDTVFASVINAANNLQGAAQRSWREWEIEALTAAQEHLTALTAHLCAQGAYPSLSDSKIARAAGVLLPKARKNANAQLLAALLVQEEADTMQAQLMQQPSEVQNAAFAVQTQRIAELRRIARELTA